MLKQYLTVFCCFWLRCVCISVKARLIMWPSYRPHFMSVHVPYGLLTWKQKCRKIRIGIDDPQGTSASFQLKRSKVKVTGRQKPPQSGVVFTYGQWISCRRILRRLQTRHTPLLGLIHCWHLNRRCSAGGWMTACHVSTRRWRAFFFWIGTEGRHSFICYVC